MSSKMRFKAEVFDDEVEFETDIMGSVTREFIDAKSGVQDKSVRQWLIKQGWVPPEMSSAAPDMYRALRGLFELLSFDDKYMHLDEVKAAEAALAKADREQS